jgi:hypothetical protein
MELHAAVLLLTLGCHAAGDRMTVAHAHRLKARGGDAAFDQDVTDLIGPLLRKLQIGLVIADGVGMALDPHHKLRASF